MLAIDIVSSLSDLITEKKTPRERLVGQRLNIGLELEGAFISGQGTSELADELNAVFAVERGFGDQLNFAHREEYETTTGIQRDFIVKTDSTAGLPDDEDADENPEMFSHSLDRTGAEIVSPRVAATDSNIRRIAQIFARISDHIKLHDNAGFHLHVSLPKKIKDVHLGRMVLSWADKEDEWEEKAARKHSSPYTESVVPAANSILQGLKDAVEQRDARLFVEGFKRGLKTVERDAINLSGLDRRGTIEFRLGSSRLARSAERLEDFIKRLVGHVRYGLRSEIISYKFGKRRYGATVTDSGKAILYRREDDRWVEVDAKPDAPEDRELDYIAGQGRELWSEWNKKWHDKIARYVDKNAHKGEIDVESWDRVIARFDYLMDPSTKSDDMHEKASVASSLHEKIVMAFGENAWPELNEFAQMAIAGSYGLSYRQERRKRGLKPPPAKGAERARVQRTTEFRGRPDESPYRGQDLEQLRQQHRQALEKGENTEAEKIGVEIARQERMGQRRAQKERGRTKRRNLGLAIESLFDL